MKVIVVGSGFGGAIAACRLAQAGFDVTILERGRRFEQGDFPNLPDDSSVLPDERRWSWDLDQGLWEVLDLGGLVSVQAAGYGGGSLVYANVHLRPPRAVFDERWPATLRGRTALDPFFDLAASMLEVAPVTEHPAFHAEIAKGSQLANAARRLGRDVFHPPLALRYAPSGPNQHGVEQGRCTGCGACCTGCPQRAKNTLDLNYLALAERWGARAVTQCEVLELVELGARGWLVRCFDHLETRRRKFRADAVFLCAGAINSTRLMLHSKLLRRRRALGAGYHPGAGAIGVVYGTTHPQRPSVGPAISTSLVEWSGDSAFFLLQDGGYPKPLDRLVGVLRASAWLNRNRRTRAQHSDIEPPPLPPVRPLLGRSSVPLVSSRAASVLDAVLAAAREGSFRDAAPDALRTFTAKFAHGLEAPLRLSSTSGLLVELRARPPVLATLRSTVSSALDALVERVPLAQRSMGNVAVRALLATGRFRPAGIAARLAGYESDATGRRAVLLAMGCDAVAGVLRYDRRRRRMRAELDMAELLPGYARQEAAMRRVASELGGELRTNPAMDFLRKPLAVHNQGGCRMSDDAEQGATDACGKVHGTDGLYILDGSLLSASVGVNPSATIAAIAERGVLAFIRRYQPDWPDASAGGEEYRRQCERAGAWAAHARARDWALEPPAPRAAVRVPLGSSLGVEFTETLSGYYGATRSAPKTRERFLALEARGRPGWPVKLRLDNRVDDVAAFFADPTHTLRVGGTLHLRLPGHAASATFPITGGSMRLLTRDLARPAAEDGEEARRIDYRLPFADGATRWLLSGTKRIARTSSFEAWRQTSTLSFTLTRMVHDEGPGVIEGAGCVRVGLRAFVFETVPSLRAVRAPHATTEPGQEAWVVAEFAAFFFGTLQRIYLPALRTAVERSRGGRSLQQGKP
jgi:choline dehydrogenase-like flavoprotein